MEIESRIDLNGFLQLAPLRAGLNGVRATVRVKSNADQAALQDLLQITRRAAPVYDSVANPVTIESTVERM